MNINRWFLSLAFLFSAVFSMAAPQKKQPKQTVNPVSVTAVIKKDPAFASSPVHHFAILWSRADSLANLGQPKSALEIVEKIYQLALAGKNDPEVIKAIIYRIRLNSEFRENFLSSAISGLQKEIAASTVPRKQVLESILAEMYQAYYRNNQYRFSNRTQVKPNLPDSLETWDLATLSNAIARTYLLSLGDAGSLQKIPVGNFDILFDQGVFPGGKKDTLVAQASRFCPTFYDFLAGRALSCFSSGETGVNLPGGHFEVDQPWYFEQPSGFTSNRMAIPADTSAPASFALRIFRDLAAFHLEDKDRGALIDAELKRFAFVRENYVLPGKDSLYQDALTKFEQAEIRSPWSASVSFALATHLISQGHLYQPLVSDRHKWDIRSAVAVCDRAVRLFPGAEGSKNCKIVAKTAREPFLQVTAESAVPPGKPSLALIGIKNIRQLFFRIVKSDPETYSAKTALPDPGENFKYFAALPAEKSWSQNFPDDGDYQKHQAEIKVPELPAGFWVLLCSTANDFPKPGRVFAFTPFWSTQISYIGKRNENGSYSHMLFDRESGASLKNATVEVWEKNYEYKERKYVSAKLQDLTSDGQGYFEIPSSGDNRQNSNRFLKIRYKGDFLVTDNFYQYPVYKPQVQTTMQTMFYTDRAIYRPGQVVYFKGIVLERTGDETKIRAGYKTKVVFTDVNGQKVSELNLTSGDFGSINGSFIAPTGVLPGQMTISNESGSAYVSVEEYKRPTFEVACEPLEGNYKLGGLITVTGKAGAFAGNPIDAAKVRYRVVRNARFPFWDWNWRWPVPVSPQVEITSGTTTTDDRGKFNLTFIALPDPNIEQSTSPVFDFTVYADVTDLNGETQSAEQNVSVGYKSLLIGAGIPEMVNLAKDTVCKITATNLNGRPTPAAVTVTLQLLRQPDRAYKTRRWDRPDIHLLSEAEFHAAFPFDVYDDENNPATWAKEQTVFEKTVNPSVDSLVNLLDPASRVPHPGSYLLTLKATDPDGEAVEVKKYLTAVSPASKEVPVNIISWFVPLKTGGEPGEAAKFLVGSKEDNVNMVYEVRLHDSLVSRQFIKLNNRAVLLEIPIKEQYRGNFSVDFVFVRHNRVFQNSQLVNVPFSNKKLDISIGSFRSKLDPGAKETWKITISAPGGGPAKAEFLAAMYDASLDLFRSNSWSFNLYQRYSGIIPWEVENAFRIAHSQWFSPDLATADIYVHPELRLNWFGMNYTGGQGLYSRAVGFTMDKSMRPRMSGTLMDGSDTPPPSPEAQQEVVIASGNPTENGLPSATPVQPSMQIRRDFRETAFFYPRLETDSAGSLVLQFNAPESLTRWKLLGLAHTKNLEYGLVEKELVTSKELMVFPNAPRFVRQGDTVIFSAKIVNLSNRDLAGEVTLALSDAITLKSLNSLADTLPVPASRIPDQLSHKLRQPFIVTTGQSASVSWKLVIPVRSDLAVLQYRVSAVSGSFSDGEEKAIPVLTNRMLVTESLPLPVRGKGTTAFSFDKLLTSGSPDQKDATLKNYRLTLEFASNPAWYAIQALPSLNEQQYENADGIFTAFWSNSIAAYIANSNPKIKAVFESWKNLTPDALRSNLAKNQELKSALLQETPWVMDANSETERKQKLGLFFDPDNLGVNLQESLGKLKKLQTPGGGWTWFEGMPENRFITQNIVTGLGQLHHLGITNIMKDPSSREMVTRAIGFLDREIGKDYENLEKYYPSDLDKNHLGSAQIQYLYARSFFMNDTASRIPYPASPVKEAFEYYQNQAEKYWLQNDRSLQGMIALALHRLGGSDIPGLIVKSFTEKAISSKEMGMYWASDRGYFWYQAPIETQALMIEAFDEILQNPVPVEEMKIWLLKQKQTQDWRTPHSTLEACYALLLRGTDRLSEDPGVKITLGKEKISSDQLTDVKKEAGTGYFRLTWTGNDIRPEMGNITVSKTSEGAAWGAVYWQYFENLDKITPASTPMKLEKKVFLETNTPSGPVLEPISNPGSRIPDPGTPVQPFVRFLHVGDKLVVRIVLTVDRDLEYVHMKDMRASAFEPLPPASSTKKDGRTGSGLSGYRFQEGLGYYQSTTDVATNFFFDYLPKGTYVFEYTLKVNAEGAYSNGITTIQCMYAPEFTAHSEGTRVSVESGGE